MLVRKIGLLLFPVVSSLALFACTEPAPDDTSAASSAVSAPASSCYDQCAAAAIPCPNFGGPGACGASVEECRAATQICYDSCDRGVGPWLPC